jgi:hypothetical protein
MKDTDSMFPGVDQSPPFIDEVEKGGAIPPFLISLYGIVLNYCNQDIFIPYLHQVLLFILLASCYSCYSF